MELERKARPARLRIALQDAARHLARAALNELFNQGKIIRHISRLLEINRRDDPLAKRFAHARIEHARACAIITISTKSERVAHAMFRTSRERYLRAPVHHDVVVNFAICGNFNERDSTPAPSFAWFDPRTGTTVIERLKVCKIAKLARALHEAEALRIVVNERTDLQRLGIGQRTPQRFPSAVHHQKPIGVVHRRAEIRETIAIGLVKLEHRSKRRDANIFQLATREKRSADTHLKRCAVGDFKAVRPRQARPIK